jgi:uncharacterized protein involved in outer membrane biogenesis
LTSTSKLRKPNLWVISILGVLVLLVAVVVIYIGTRSDDWWREQLTTRLTQTLGRELEIQGAFHLDLGRRIVVEAASVRLVNPDWTESRDMLRIGSLLLEFDLLSALGDTLLIHRLELAGLDVALEEDQVGEQNWVFDIKTSQAPTPKPDEFRSFPVQIEKLSLQQAQLSLVQPERERPLVFQVDTITGAQTPDDEVVLDGTGQLGGLPLTIKGKLGKITDVLKLGRVSYQLNGKLGDASLSSTGSIDALGAPFRPKIDVSISGPEILQITRAMGVPSITEGPFETRINVAPDGNGMSGQLRGKLGTLNLDIDLYSEGMVFTDNVEISAQLSGENLAAIADLLELPPLPKGAFEVDAKLQRDDGVTQIEKMIASVGKHQLSVGGVIGGWPEMQGTRLEVKAQGPDLAAFAPTVAVIHLAKLPPGAYTANALIEPSDNGIQIRRSEIRAGGYQATAEGQVFTRGQFHAELNVTGSGPDLSMITRLVDIIQLPPWPFQASGRIDITGHDITIIGATGTTGDNELAVDGPIAFSETGPLRLDIKASGSSLQAVLRGLGYDVIPAEAAYQVEGNVEFVDNHIRVTAKRAQLGQATASGKLNIPDLDTPTTLVVDVDNVKTPDVEKTLALVGVELDLFQVVPADLKGQVRRTKNSTRLSSVRGSIGGARVKVSGSIGDPPDYLKTRLSLDIAGENLEHFLDHPVEQAIPFQIKGNVIKEKEFTRFENLMIKLAGITGQVNGHVGSWNKIDGSELSVSAQGDSLDAIAAILERPLPEGSASFDGHLSGVGDTFHIDRMTAHLGRNNLSGDLKLTKGEPPLLSGNLRSSYLDLSLLFQEDVLEEVPSENAEQSPETTSTDNVVKEPPEKDRQRVFQDTPIELDMLEKLGLDLDLRIDEVANVSEQGSLLDLSAKVLIKDGDIWVTELEGGGPLDGKLSGDLVVMREADKTSVDIDIKGEQIRIGLAAAPGQDPATYPPTDIEAHLTGEGSTYHQLAASLDGRIKVVQGEGRVNNNSMNFLLSDVLYELFQTINPFSRSESTTQLNCSVFIADFEKGTANIQALVIQTDKLNIVSAGTVELKTERINIGFSTRPRKGLGISASMITNPLIRLGGTMSRPAIALDAGGATVATGAAVATGGLSILAKGFWDRFLSARDPCGQALKRDAKLQGKKTEQPEEKKDPDSAGKGWLD